MARWLLLGSFLASRVCVGYLWTNPIVGVALGVQTTSSPQLALQSIGRHHLLSPSVSSRLPEVQHQKEPGQGYMPGSPLHQKQQALKNNAAAVEKGETETGGKESHTGLTFASGMFCTIVLLSIVFSLTATSNKVISAHTWLVLDQVILIFIAVMTYQATEALVEFIFELPHSKLLAAALQAVVFFLVAFLLSWVMRNEVVSLGILCGAGAHFTSFASTHMTGVATEHFAGGSLGYKLLTFVIFAAIFFAFGFAIHLLKKQARLKHDEWNEQITDMENDFAAMALAVVWTLIVCFLICGEDIELEVDPKKAHAVEMWQEVLLLAYAFVLIPISILLHKRLSSMASGGTKELGTRLVMFMSSFTAMSSAWAMLLWGQMHFYSHYCREKPIFCRMVFAMEASLAAAVVIVALSLAQGQNAESTISREITVALTALSLVVGWSWEQCFDAAIEVVAEELEHESHHIKIFLTAALLLVVVPTYALYIKPVVIQKTAGVEY